MAKYYPGRILVVLSRAESKALITMARQDVRCARDQVCYLIIEEAKRRGLWESISAEYERSDDDSGGVATEVDREAA